MNRVIKYSALKLKHFNKLISEKSACYRHENYINYITLAMFRSFAVYRFRFHYAVFLLKWLCECETTDTYRISFQLDPEFHFTHTEILM